MKFVNLIGNEKVKDQLSCLLESKRFPQALIIEGEEGIGKRTLAKDIALNLFCRGEEKPCLKCPQCSKVMNNVHPDFIEYTAENRAMAFKVETVREIRDSAFLSPNEAEYKLYVLANAQSMSPSAQNALLKILEEPPSYDIFILTVTNKSLMLSTILSRCVVVSLEGVNPDEGANYISKTHEDIGFAEAKKALETNGGNIGKSIETIENEKLTRLGETAEEIALNIIADNEYELIKTMSAFERDNKSLSKMLITLKEIIAGALFGEKETPKAYSAASKELSSRLSREKLVKLMEVCDNSQDLITRNVNNKILMTKTCADLRRAAGR